MEQFKTLTDCPANEEEIQRLYIQYPDLKRLLGSEYMIRKDRTGGYYIVDAKGKISLGVKLFLTIASAHGL